MIYGETENLKKSILEEIQALETWKDLTQSFVPLDLLWKMVHITAKINKEIGVYLDRKGRVQAVFVGDSATVSLPPVPGRRDPERLNGLRCLHTHPNTSGQLSKVDEEALRVLRFDSMIGIGVEEGTLSDVFAGFLGKGLDGEDAIQFLGPLNEQEMEDSWILEECIQKDSSAQTSFDWVDEREEKAVLVGITLETSGKGSVAPVDPLAELAELTKTAGALVVSKVMQKKNRIDATFFLGKGKIEEIALLRQALGANMIVFDDELSGAQIRNIEDVVGVKVVDRTTLILDIFSKRARSREGKLQVELAQLNYRLPRLMGMGHILSRLGGGIGTRGPGEKKLETDRRHIRKRIQFLEREIKQIQKNRITMRERREKNEVPTIALVGYTNAGKSTLLNALTHSDVLAEDKLFATLDPISRALNLPDGRRTILIDTVGFIQKLPHQLVEAFKATLEEVLFADLLLHVIDASSPFMEDQIHTVNTLLESLGAQDKKMLMVYNKSDISQENSLKRADVIKVSALKEYGLRELLQSISDRLEPSEQFVDLCIPYEEGWVYPFLCENARIQEKKYEESGMRVLAWVKRNQYHRVHPFMVTEKTQ